MRPPAHFVMLLVAMAGCAAPREPPREPPPAPVVPAVRPEPEPTLAGNDILVYPVKNGRAQDLADTLLPLLQAMYGPGVRIVAHAPSNKLLVYLPPREDRQQFVGAGGARSPAVSPPVPPVPPARPAPR